VGQDGHKVTVTMGKACAGFIWPTQEQLSLQEGRSILSITPECLGSSLCAGTCWLFLSYALFLGLIVLFHVLERKH
jgi:hypothetical protein